MVTPKPDLYGPFWIAITWILSLVICVILGQFFKNGMGILNYSFSHIPSACSLVFCFTFGTPLLIAGLFKCFDSSIGMVEGACVFGYSALMYIPATLIAVIPYKVHLSLYFYLKDCQIYCISLCRNT